MERIELNDVENDIIRIARFEKVSIEQFISDYIKLYPSVEVDKIVEIYNGIILPKRATEGSAGYDFCSTVMATITPRQSIIIPSGIRAKITPGWVLQLYPRSSYGMKYRMQMDNTVGIIDSDYYNANNEGHIMMKITNDSTASVEMKLLVGDRFCQGIFIPHGITVDDNVSTKRTGGMGSTGT